MHSNDPGTVNSALQQARPEPMYVEDDEIDLREYLDLLLANKWLITGITALSVFLGGTYAFTATPVYQADALLQVEDQNANPLTAMEDLGFMGGKSPADTEIQILRSRAVVGQAVERLHLTVSAEPKYFPFIGEPVARRYSGEGPAEPWLGLISYAWGGERIRISRFVVPDALKGEPFTLVTGENDTYDILDPEGDTVLSGKVGEEAWSAEERFGAFVSDLDAHPGTEFEVTSRSWLQVVNQLRDSLSFSESGKSTGIIRVSMAHTDSQQAEGIVQAIAEIYLRQNVERRSAQAEESLRFLEKQLPELRAELEAAEDDLSAYRRQHRAVDLGAEAQSVLQRLVTLEAQLNELELKRAELTKGFKPDHPRIQALNEQREELEQAGTRLEAEIEALPDTQQEILRFTRKVEVGTELYTALLNRAQELRIIEAGTVGNVRIIDPAVASPSPIKPNKALVLSLSFVLGGLMAVMLVSGRYALRRSIGDPELIERRLGVSVYAAVPFTRHQRCYRRSERRRGYHRLPLLAAEYPEDLATESLRSFRTSLHFAMLDAGGNRIVIAGPAPGIGKSFIASNTAYLLGESGKRVLLIDADMRRGHLHEHVGSDQSPGLSDVLGGRLAWQDVKQSLTERCDVLPSGTIPPNPSELLMGQTLEDLLREADRKYDYVLIDTPPVLAVVDATILAAMANAVFMVVRAGATEMGELELASRRLRQNRGAVSGVVVNAMSRRTQGYGRTRYYQYEYQG